MKNKKSNVGSFATAKLQTKMRSILAIIAIVAVIGFSFAACGDDSTDGNKSPFEETWVSEPYGSGDDMRTFEFIFTGNKFSYLARYDDGISYYEIQNATFTYTKTEITITHSNGALYGQVPYSFSNGKLIIGGSTYSKK